MRLNDIDRVIAIEEQVFLNRRKDRITMALAAAALVAAVTVGGGALAGGLGIARDVGSSTAKIEQLERQSENTSTTSVELGRVSERLNAIDRRLSSIEDGLNR